MCEQHGRVTWAPEKAMLWACRGASSGPQAPVPVSGEERTTIYREPAPRTSHMALTPAKEEEGSLRASCLRPGAQIRSLILFPLLTGDEGDVLTTAATAPVRKCLASGAPAKCCACRELGMAAEKSVE